MQVTVIGAYGSAGVAVAERLVESDMDVDVTLVDDGDPGGGLCILQGCMPSKEVLSAAAHKHQAATDPRVKADPEVDLEEVISIKDDHIHAWAEHRRAAVHELAERSDVEFIHDTARFVDNRIVEAGDKRFESDYVVVATGSTVNIPDLPGIHEVPYCTSADVLDRTSFGDTGVVMGFGTVALEFAPYLKVAADMDLTVIEHDDAPLDEADPEFGEHVLDIYRDEFDLEILTNTYEQSVEPTDDGVRLHVERDGETTAVEADELFLFTGRRPNIDGLGIHQNTSIEPRRRWVKDTMQTRDDPRVYVVGDANGKEPILHVAKEQGFVAAENILRQIRGEDQQHYTYVTHRVVFSGLAVYPYARLGLTEREARQQGLDYVAVSRDASSDGVFLTKDAPHGHAKLVVEEDGTVLGYQGLHLHSDVMAKTMQVVVERGMNVHELPDRAYHPTTPEILDGLFREAKTELNS